MTLIEKIVYKIKQLFNGYILRNPDDLLALEYIREDRRYDFRHRYNLMPGDIVFDLGAHKGSWCDRILLMYPESRMHLFELLPEYAEDLIERFHNFDNVTVNDTISFGDDTITPVVVSTYKTRGLGPEDILRSVSASGTRTNTKNKLESLYNVIVVIDGDRLLITNNNNGPRGNVQLTSSFSTGSNFITGFSGGEVGGNVVMNFNNTNRIPSDIRDQQKFDPTSRGKTVIATRFSAPGGFETMSEIFLDIPSKEYSVYNAMPFRNLSVRGSGSGETGTIRVNSHANRREGLRTLLARHSGRFGIDSQWGTVPTDNYDAEASFQKINRNTRLVVTGSLVISEKHDNFNVSRAIPSQDYGYSWVTASLGNELSIRSGNQLSFGYWPKNGVLSASANVSWRQNGFDSAVNFPTGSSILGS